MKRQMKCYGTKTAAPVRSRRDAGTEGEKDHKTAVAAVTEPGSW